MCIEKARPPIYVSFRGWLTAVGVDFSCQKSAASTLSPPLSLKTGLVYFVERELAPIVGLARLGADL